MEAKISHPVLHLFIGTYNSDAHKGIYICRLNLINGIIEQINTIEADNPSYLTISKDGQYLYSVNETMGQSEVSAFKYNPEKGQLEFINRQSSVGEAPCYVTIGPGDKWLFSANYMGGNIAVFPINPDGSIADATQLIQHKGRSRHPVRQCKSHVHSVVLSPDGKYLICADLGLDKVFSYPLNLTKKRQPLESGKATFINTPPGSGPRHIAFHPRLPYVYIIGELSGTISICTYDSGHLKLIQHDQLPLADLSDNKSCADIHLSPDGKFLYISTRGASNNIGIYSVSAIIGNLRFIGFQSTLGITPRNFVIDPSGQFLLVANQDSNNLIVFKRDIVNGTLRAVSDPLSIPKPVCLKFV